MQTRPWRLLVLWCILVLGSSVSSCTRDTLAALWAVSDDTNIMSQLHGLSGSDPRPALQQLPDELLRSDIQHRRKLRQTRQTVTLTERAKRQYIDVVVVAPSAALWLDRRTRLRQQFPRNMQLAPVNTSAILKFAIGTTEEGSSLYNETRAEDAEFSDMIFFDCIDADDALNWHPNWKLEAGPSSTTCKVMNSVQWAVKRFDFQYFFRLGDDSYLRIDKFLNMLAQKELPTGKAVIGQILTAVILNMDQQYAQGMGYALTPEVCDFIAAAAPWLLDTAPEDGVVARWLFAAGTQFVNHKAWRALDLGETCDEDMVLAHKLPVELWSNITSDGLVEC